MKEQIKQIIAVVLAAGILTCVPLAACSDKGQGGNSDKDQNNSQDDNSSDSSDGNQGEVGDGNEDSGGDDDGGEDEPKVEKQIS